MWLATKTADNSAAPSPVAASSSAPISIPAPAPAAAPVPTVGEVGVATGATGPGTEVSATPVTHTASESVRNAAPRSHEQTAHVLAVYSRLAPDEQRVVQRVATRMAADVRAQWLSELASMTVDDAVELVRSMIPVRTTKGGDS